MSEQKTYYRCSGYNLEICGDCPYGDSHEYRDECCDKDIPPLFCPTIQKNVLCIEYDRDPCGDPTCPDCTGGDGVSCGGKV